MEKELANAVRPYNAVNNYIAILKINHALFLAISINIGLIF